MNITFFKSVFLLSAVLYSALFFGTESVSAYSVPYSYAEHSYLGSYSQSSYGGGGGGGGSDPETNLPCGCQVQFDPSQQYPNGTVYLDQNDNGTLDEGDWVDGVNGGQGSSSGGPSRGGGICTDYGITVPCPHDDLSCRTNHSAPCYSQSSYYTQSTYYSQSAYEDTPEIGTGDPTSPRVSLYIQKTGGDGWSKNLQATPDDEVTLRWVTTNTNQCQSVDTTEFTVSDTSGTSGSTGNVTEPATGLRVYEISCRGTNGTTVTSSASITVSTTPLEFTAIPKIVRTNETSRLTWDVNGRTGCIIAKKSNNTDLTTITTDSGSRDTVPLTGETTYRLSCTSDGAQAEATIRVLPIYSET